MLQCAQAALGRVDIRFARLEAKATTIHVKVEKHRREILIDLEDDLHKGVQLSLVHKHGTSSRHFLSE